MEKEKSLGQTMTLAEACEFGWNSVRVWGTDIIAFYDPSDDKVYVDFDEDDFNGTYEELLQKKIKLDDNWQEDEDGYPIVYGEFVEEDEAA